MRTLIAITLVVCGGALVALPTLTTQRQLQRVAAFYETQGGGARLPDELRPQPNTNFDWAYLGAGTFMATLGAWLGRFAQPGGG